MLELNLIFIDFLLTPIEFVFDPGKRLFFVYLLSSLVFAFLTLSFEKKREFSGRHPVFFSNPRPRSPWNLNKLLTRLHGIFKLEVFGSLFHKKLFFHPSTRTDLSLLLFNSFLKSFIFLFVVFNSVIVAKFALKGLYFLSPQHSPGRYNYNTVILIFTLTHFVFMDFFRFLQHYCFHRIPFLWKFHKIHHSARIMTPLTLYRTHPVESLVSSLRRILVTGVLSGLFLFYTQSVIDIYTIMGVNALDFIFNFFASNLRHSHVWLSFGPLNRVFVSPAHHQIHHSRNIRHRDKNMGFALSLWDQLFGTFYQVGGSREFLVFGVRGENHQSLWQALKAPFSS